MWMSVLKQEQPASSQGRRLSRSQYLHVLIYREIIDAIVMLGINWLLGLIKCELSAPDKHNVYKLSRDM